MKTGHMNQDGSERLNAFAPLGLDGELAVIAMTGGLDDTNTADRFSCTV